MADLLVGSNSLALVLGRSLLPAQPPSLHHPFLFSLSLSSSFPCARARAFLSFRLRWYPPVVLSHLSSLIADPSPWDTTKPICLCPRCAAAIGTAPALFSSFPFPPYELHECEQTQAACSDQSVRPCSPEVGEGGGGVREEELCVLTPESPARPSSPPFAEISLGQACARSVKLQGVKCHFSKPVKVPSDIRRICDHGR